MSGWVRDGFTEKVTSEMGPAGREIIFQAEEVGRAFQEHPVSLGEV